MTISESLAKGLSRKRFEKGLTLEELSKLSGVTAPQISMMENEKTMPTLRTLEKLALALDTKVFYLLKGDE
jgi:transcriptional regulator with XRE-family HTH domain